MPRSTFTRIVLLSGCLAVTAAAAEPDAPALAHRYEAVVQPFLKNHCLACHGARKREGKLDLSVYSSLQAVVKDHAGLGAGARAARGGGDAARGGAAAARLRTSAGRSSRGSPSVRERRGPTECGRSRVGAGTAAEQRRVRLHDPRPDGRRHPADAGVPGRSRRTRPGSTTRASRWRCRRPW